MLRTFNLRPAMSSISIGVLLLANTLGVAVARRTLSSHRAMRDTAFAQSCGQCPELRMCSAEQDYTTPNDGTWDRYGLCMSYE